MECGEAEAMGSDCENVYDLLCSVCQTVSRLYVTVCRRSFVVSVNHEAGNVAITDECWMRRVVAAGCCVSFRSRKRTLIDRRR